MRAYILCLLAFLAASRGALAEQKDNSYKAFGPADHNLYSDTLATIFTNVRITLEKSEERKSYVYSLDYDFHNIKEGNKASSVPPVIFIDFVGDNGVVLPAPSIQSTNFFDHCTYRPNDPEHRHEIGTLVVSFDSFLSQVKGIRVRDTGVHGYQGGC